jgi:hypothetical protein
MKKGLVLGLACCLTLFLFGLIAYVLGWVRLNRVDGRMFVTGQPFFIHLLTEGLLSNLYREMSRVCRVI